MAASHLIAYIAAVVGVSQRQMVAAIRTAFKLETQEVTHEEWATVTDLGKPMQDAEHDVITDMMFPKGQWIQLQSTNPLDRLNGEIQAADHFDCHSVIGRLVDTMLPVQNDEWAVERRSINLEMVNGLAMILTASPAESWRLDQGPGPTRAWGRGPGSHTIDWNAIMLQAFVGSLPAKFVLPLSSKRATMIALSVLRT